MIDSRIKNVKRNMIGEFIYRIVSLLLPFVSRTLIIYILGALYLGLNSLYSSVFSILSLAELGFGSAMVFSMYEPIAKGQVEEVCALLNLYKKIYRYVGLAILVLGLLIMFFLPGIIKGEIPADVNIYALYLIFLVSSSISYFLFAYKESLLIVNQRNDINSKIGIAISISSTLLQILLLTLFENYYVFCIVSPIFSIIRNLLVNHITNKIYPQYICKGVVLKSKMDDIKKRVLGLFIYKICYVFRDSIDGISISAFLGLLLLAKFNNYFFIISTVTGFFMVVKTSMSASVGNSIVLEDEKKNYEDFKKFQTLFMLLSSWGVVCLYCLIQPFVLLWIGPSYMFDDLVVFLFCALFYCYKMGDMCAVYRQAAGLWWQDRYRPVVEAVTNLVLNIIFVQVFGVAGVVFSTIICLVFINSLWASRVLYKHYFKSFQQREYVLRILFYGFVTIVAMYFTELVANLVSVQNDVMKFVLQGMICAFFPWIILIPLYSLLPEFKDSFNFLFKVLNRNEN